MIEENRRCLFNGLLQTKSVKSVGASRTAKTDSAKIVKGGGLKRSKSAKNLKISTIKIGIGSGNEKPEIAPKKVDSPRPVSTTKPKKILKKTNSASSLPLSSSTKSQKVAINEVKRKRSGSLSLPIGSGGELQKVVSFKLDPKTETKIRSRTQSPMQPHVQKKKLHPTSKLSKPDSGIVKKDQQAKAAADKERANLIAEKTKEFNSKSKMSEGQKMIRQKSFDSSLNLEKAGRQKFLQGYKLRRRFSQGAIQPIREILDEMELQNQVESEKVEKSPKEKFVGAVKKVKNVRIFLSKDQSKNEEQYGPDHYEEDGTSKELRSLTGSNTSGWKFQDSFYGILNLGRRPSMDTAWGRRIYDQYEIEYEVDKPKHGYLKPNLAKNLPEEIPNSQTGKKEARRLGLWDVIFNPEIVPVLESAKKWEADHEERAKQIKKLNIDVAKLESDVVVITEATKDDPISRFAKQFCKTGSYLRPDDMKFCIEKTNFTEDQIIDWFRRFKKDCPDARLTVDHLRLLFRQVFPNGDGEKFSFHIMRIFDSDGNGFLDFKEFLMAIDIATCQTEESKLAWAFKLYDLDNDGVIDLQEMANVIETLESLDSTGGNSNSQSYNKSRSVGLDDQDEDPGSEVQTSPLERAQTLFSALDIDLDGTLTLNDFVRGYMERSVLMAKQDAQEQKKRLDCLLFRGPLVPNFEDFQDDQRLMHFVCGLIYKRIGVDILSSELSVVALRQATEYYPRCIFVRFEDVEKRNQIWKSKSFAKKNGLLMEEWLTEHRARLYKKCKEMKAAKLIKDVFTVDGDVFVILLPPSKKVATLPDFVPEKRLVITDAEFDKLVKETKKKTGGNEEGILPSENQKPKIDDQEIL